MAECVRGPTRDLWVKCKILEVIINKTLVNLQSFLFT